MRHPTDFRTAPNINSATASASRFEDAAFDFVFTNGSLHEWANPKGTFDEIGRVLKPGGRYLISDLRRDINPLARGILWFGCRPASMRPGLISSLNAAYTASELPAFIGRHLLGRRQGESQFVGNLIFGYGIKRSP